MLLTTTVLSIRQEKQIKKEDIKKNNVVTKKGIKNLKPKSDRKGEDDSDDEEAPKNESTEEIEKPLKPVDDNKNTTACPNNCSGNGTCNDGSCDCNDGYLGDDCSTKVNAPESNPTPAPSPPAQSGGSQNLGEEKPLPPVPTADPNATGGVQNMGDGTTPAPQSNSDGISSSVENPLPPVKDGDTGDNQGLPEDQPEDVNTLIQLPIDYATNIFYYFPYFVKTNIVKLPDQINYTTLEKVCKTQDCDRCDKDGVCKKCNTGFILHKDTCVKTCPKGFIVDTIRMKCVVPDKRSN